MEARRRSTESDLIIDVFFTNVIRGKDGITPHIGSNKHWYLGDMDTGVVAEGKNGKNGEDGRNGDTPVIGSNGNWWIGGKDTGKSSNASIPAGIITMWSGSIDSIPEGWALCDGGGVLSNGGRIPDLRGRFIVGYDSRDSDYNGVGKTGGEKLHQLTKEELAPHIHDLKDYYHAESKTRDVDYEDYITRKESEPLVAPVRKFVGSGDTDLDNNYFFYYEHATKFGGGLYNNGSAVGSKGHENRPPYYTLAYIIKL